MPTSLEKLISVLPPRAFLPGEGGAPNWRTAEGGRRGGLRQAWGSPVREDPLGSLSTRLL